MCNFCVARYPQLGRRAVGEKAYYWENGADITIGFIGGTQAERDLVKRNAQIWDDLTSVSFVWTQDDPMVRISFVPSDGSWSYVGTSCLFIPDDQPTMNFGWLDQAVVKHEFGHMMGLGHEHQNPNGAIQWNTEAVIRDLSGPPNYWSVADIKWNVLDRYSFDRVDATELDPKSIMMYQFPNEWTIGDFETSFNIDLSQKDKEFIQSLYPPIDNSHDIKVDFARTIFQDESELRRLKESSLVRLGKELGLPVDEQYLKSVNRETVWNYLYGNYQKNLCEKLGL